MGRTLLHLRQKNVVGILGFKPYFGFWFHQGVLLEHRKKVLIDAQEGKTKALWQWRMNSPNDIKPATIKVYVREAIQPVEDGAKSQSETLGSGSIESDPIDQKVCVATISRCDKCSYSR